MLLSQFFDNYLIMVSISAIMGKCLSALFVVALFFVLSCAVKAQDKSFFDQADSIVKYQLPNGGWVKNQDWLNGVDARYIELCRIKGVGATIDNGATYSEMKHLAKAYYFTGKEQYRQSFIKGLCYLLSAQYSNGGWPQFYPSRGVGHYSSHITFNDGAMTNVLRIMRDISLNRSPYSSLNLSDSLIDLARQSYDKGVECILLCQIRTGGELTVWCQQHDSVSLRPVKARAYELPSFSAHGETVDILNLLMDIEAPSERVVQAVTCAIDWLIAHEMKGVVVERFVNVDGKPDVRLVSRTAARGLWARYYDLQNAEPLFCDRDGVPRKCIDDIGYERRMGYSWFGDSPKNVIVRFGKWLKIIR